MRRFTVAAPIVASAVVLAACGGGGKVDDIASPIAQECKAKLLALFQADGGKGLAELDAKAPASCKKVADRTGEEIIRQVTAESLGKAKSEFDTAMRDVAGPPPSAGGAETSAAVAQAPVSRAERCASFKTTSGKPRKLPVGNAEWRLEKVVLEESVAKGRFGGTFEVRYIGEPERSIDSCTSPRDLLVYENGKKVAAVLIGEAFVNRGELRKSVISGAREDAYVKGPYTYVLTFKV